MPRKLINKELIIIEFNNNKKIKEIAKLLNYTEQTVRKVLVNKGIYKTRQKRPKYEWTDSRVNKLRELIEDGVNYYKISDILNIPSKLVSTQALKMGYKERSSQKWTEQETKKLIKLIYEGEKADNIATILDRTFYSLGTKLRKLKIRKLPQVILINSYMNEGKGNSKIKMLKNRLWSIRRQVKAKNWEYDIDLQYLLDLWDKQKGLCAYSNKLMSFDKNDKNVISIDRIDSKKGYIQGNVALVRWKINQAKSNLLLEDFKLMCKEVYLTFNE